MEENLKSLVEALVQEPTETEWLEFKKDNAEAKMIGQDISALANGALLAERPQAYMVWGVDDKTHRIIGTEFSPYAKSMGNQELLSWLLQMLSENARFRFEEIVIEDKKVVLLLIEPASQYPVAFQKEPYIRAGSYTKRLADQSKLHSRLWAALSNELFELSAALRDLTPEEVEEKLAVGAYFQRLALKAPDQLGERIKYLEADRIIKKQENRLFSITNFGALLLANNFSEFPSISRKEIRVVQYCGTSRKDILRSKTFEQGYAVCVSDLLAYIDALLPSSEPISNTGERKTVRAYPPAVVRELLMNALIHQDLTSTGNCVQCEIFDNRVEITNPGSLLVEKNRIVDMPPPVAKCSFGQSNAPDALLRRIGHRLGQSDARVRTGPAAIPGHHSIRNLDQGDCLFSHRLFRAQPGSEALGVLSALLHHAPERQERNQYDLERKI